MRLARQMIIYLVAVFSSLAVCGTQNHKAHVHGMAKLTIALETEKSGSVAIDVPAESFLGFEHHPKTSAEKKTLDGAFDKFKNNVSSVVQFDPGLGCGFSDAKIDFEPAEPGAVESGHADLNASYSFHCAKELQGSSFHVLLMKLFPRVHQISVQIITQTSQTENKVSHAEETLKF